MSASTFHPFPELPTELRRLIWKEALPGPRFLHPFLDRGACDYCCQREIVAESHQKDPVILQVNHEARELALEHYQKREPVRHGCKYINYEIDILYHELGFLCSRCGKYSGGDPSPEVAWIGAKKEMLLGDRIALRVRRDVHYFRHIFVLFLRSWLSSYGTFKTMTLIIASESSPILTPCCMRKEPSMAKLREWIPRSVQELFDEISRKKELEGIVWVPPMMELKGIESFEGIIVDSGTQFSRFA